MFDQNNIIENNFEKFVRLSEVEYLNNLKSITFDTSISIFDLDRMVDAIEASKNILLDSLWIIYRCKICGTDLYHVELIDNENYLNYKKWCRFAYVFD